MRAVSRRAFLLGLTDRISDQVDLAGLHFPSESPSNIDSTWVLVGRVVDLTPGVELEVRAGAFQITVNSSADGLRAERPGGVSVALRMSSVGFIYVNPNLIWPPGRKLSHATGAPVDTGNDRMAIEGGRE